MFWIARDITNAVAYGTFVAEVDAIDFCVNIAIATGECDKEMRDRPQNEQVDFLRTIGWEVTQILDIPAISEFVN